MIRFDLDVISKLLVPVGQLAVAIAVGLISYSQWRVSVRQKEIAHNKIMLDLFDRQGSLTKKIFHSLERELEVMNFYLAANYRKKLKHFGLWLGGPHR
jgi:hypothetical protein